MSEIDEQTLMRRLDAMRSQWRTLRHAHERRASSPRAALGDPAVIEELQRDLEDTMISFAQAALEWVERGHAIEWRTSPEDARALVLERAEQLDMDAGDIAAQIDRMIADFEGKPAITSAADAVEEMQRLERWTTEEELRVMEVWPDRGRVLTIEHIAARARALQDIPEDRLAFVDIGRITVMFGRMAEHLKRGWPGRAHGLARMHTPRTGTWANDARELYDELLSWRDRAPELQP